MLLLESLSPDDCHLQDGGIDIWQFSLDNPFDLANSLLNEDEYFRANRFHFAHHRRRFTVAHATLRLILARYLHQDAHSLIFTYNPHGKPQVKNSMALEFNLSHSQDLALLAVGKQFPLGIDLEFFSARPYDGIAKNLFSPHELQLFSKLSMPMKPLAFFHIWTQKEALIKACGMGLSYPTQQFDVPIIPPTQALIADKLHETTWQMTSFMPKAACSAALCHDPSIQKIRYTVVNPLNFL